MHAKTKGGNVTFKSEDVTDNRKREEKRQGWKGSAREGLMRTNNEVVEPLNGV